MRAETDAIAAALGLDPLGMLASGSLLLAADPAAVDAIVSAGRERGVAFADIGRMTASAGQFMLLDAGGSAELPEWTTDEVSRALESVRGEGNHATAGDRGTVERRKVSC